jgi:PleD family two-component response regulator
MLTHVLVYDHSASILANFQHDLDRAGFRVTARFPREIELTEIAKHRPDIIMLALAPETSRNSLERMLFVHDEPTLVHIPILLAIPDDENILVPTDVAGVHYTRYRKTPFNIDAVIAAAKAITQKR